jgi:hypothetical protein
MGRGWGVGAGAAGGGVAGAAAGAGKKGEGSVGEGRGVESLLLEELSVVKRAAPQPERTELAATEAKAWRRWRREREGG